MIKKISIICLTLLSITPIFAADDATCEDIQSGISELLSSGDYDGVVRLSEIFCQMNC